MFRDSVNFITLYAKTFILCSNNFDESSVLPPMKKSALLFGFLLLFVSSSLFAQTTLPVPRDIQATYEQGTRSKDGLPGKS